MNTVLKQDIQIRPMQKDDLTAVMAAEESAYDFPWKEPIFKNCMSIGYYCQVLEYDGLVLAHGVMTVAAGESHLLNICVHAEHQSMGLGRRLLEHLLNLALEHDVNTMFLEVRPSNFAAIKLYLDMGFNEVGTRRNYYPAKVGREDALVFAKSIAKEEEL